MVDYVDEKCEFCSECRQCWSNPDGGLWCWGCDKLEQNERLKGEKE